jgi:hypothetical protein
MDAEVPATQHQLQDLIKRKATKVSDKRINSIKQEIAALKASINNKKVERGQSSKGASGKKKRSDGDRNARGTNTSSATRNGTNNCSDEDSAGWMTVSNRSCNRQGKKQQKQKRNGNTQQGKHKGNNRHNGAGGVMKFI